MGAGFHQPYFLILTIIGLFCYYFVCYLLGHFLFFPPAARGEPRLRREADPPLAEIF